jgi:putative membrane protein
VLGLEYFDFRAVWSPIFLIVIFAIAMLYLSLVGPLRTRFADSTPPRFGQTMMFLVGLFLFYLSQGGPLSILGHLMFSAHMVAMSISYFIVPPLIILGIPAWVWSRAIQAAPRSLFKILTNPIVALISFNGLFSIYHMPKLNDYIMTHYAIHLLFYAVLFVSALMMWWPMLCPLPDKNSLSSLQKMGYIFANGVLLTPACALIIFSGQVLFASYSDPQMWAKAMGYCVSGSAKTLLQNFQGPQFFAQFSTLEDQQLGGVLMKLLQEGVYGTALAYTFFHWFKRENKSGAVDEIPEPNVLA